MSLIRDPLAGLMCAGALVIAQVVLVTAVRAQVAPDNATEDGLTLRDVVRATLDHDVAIEHSLETKRIREAEHQTAVGAFDVALGLSAGTARSNTLHTIAEQDVFGVAASRTRTTSYRIEAVKRFSSGLTVAPGIELLRRDPLTLRTPPSVRTQAGLAVSFPILRIGRRTPAAAAVEAAYLRAQASELDVRNTRALSILFAATSYWSYRSAFEALEILSASEEKAERLLQETRTLVDGGERPANDLDQLRADLADRFAARLSAEHRLSSARQELGLQMGLAAGAASTLSPPATEFPKVTHIPTISGGDELLMTARRHRYDLERARKDVDAATAALEVRQLDVRPSLDARLDVGYAAQSERSLSIGDHLPLLGPNDVGRMNTSVALVLEWPMANNTARGALAREEALLRQSRLAEVDLERQISSRIQIAIDQLRTSAAELLKTDEAVHLYFAAVQSEQKRLQLGMSTQFDLILVEERLRNTMLSRVSAALRYARAIALLRYETGTLPGVEPMTRVENYHNLLLVPPSSAD